MSRYIKSYPILSLVSLFLFLGPLCKRYVEWGDKV